MKEFTSQPGAAKSVWGKKWNTGPRRRSWDDHRFIPAHAGNIAATRSSCWCSTTSARGLRSGSSNTASRRDRVRIRLRCARQLVIKQAIPEDAVRILNELRGLQVALRPSIALQKQARRELIHRRQHLTNPTARGRVLPMRIHWLMPLQRCENDMGGRFTKRPFGIHNAVPIYLPCSLWSAPPWPDRRCPFGNFQGGRE